MPAGHGEVDAVDRVRVAEPLGDAAQHERIAAGGGHPGRETMPQPPCRRRPACSTQRDRRRRARLGGRPRARGESGTRVRARWAVPRAQVRERARARTRPAPRARPRARTRPRAQHRPPRLIGKRRDLRDLLRFGTGSRCTAESAAVAGSCGLPRPDPAGVPAGTPVRTGLARASGSGVGRRCVSGGRKGRARRDDDAGGGARGEFEIAGERRRRTRVGLRLGLPRGRARRARRALVGARLAGRAAGLVRGRRYRVREAHGVRTGVTVRLVRIDVIRHREGGCHRTNVSSGPDPGAVRVAASRAIALCHESATGARHYAPSQGSSLAWTRHEGVSRR